MNVTGGQEAVGDYTVRRAYSLGGDWAFARRLLGHPGLVELRAEYSVAGPQREVALDMFVVR